MMISAIEPALYCGRDKVVYQCTDCGSRKDRDRDGLSGADRQIQAQGISRHKGSLGWFGFARGPLFGPVASS